METVTARLVHKRVLSPDTIDFLFEATTGRFLGLEPGAHVDVHLGPDLVRQYSLWSWRGRGRNRRPAQPFQTSIG